MIVECRSCGRSEFSRAALRRIRTGVHRLVALRTVSAGFKAERSHGWLVTLNLHVEYFERCWPAVLIETQIVNRRGRTIFVEVRFRESAEPNGKVLLFASTLLLEQPAT